MPSASAADRVAVTRTYLELRERLSGDRTIAWPDAVTLRREESCSVALARALYAVVGRPYHWYDRDAWSDERLAAHLARPNVETWILRDGERPLGYFELARDADGDGSVEIVYFGLAAIAHGKGLGKRLLEGAIRAAWEMDASRVWLHTCTLDHPAALPNYQARGFVPFRTESYDVARPGLT